MKNLKIELEKFEEIFQEHMKTWFCEENDLNKASLYSLLAGGKRIRPLLCLAISRTLKGNEAVALVAGSSIEMIHTYSLIHDDLPAMDDDDLRRGKPSCHKAFTEALAILAGDSLLNEAPLFLLNMLEKENVAPEIINEFIRNLLFESGKNGMILGQVHDISLEKCDKSLMNREEKLEAVKKIHYYKTGRLFALAVKLGALSQNDITDVEFESVKKFGDQIGLAFQVIDDILDETATFDSLGKTPGKDKLMGKLTYPSILGIDESILFAKKLLKEAREELNTFARGDKILVEEVLDKLESSI
jgi:geranylgeranyl diphosphate synthase, type II